MSEFAFVLVGVNLLATGVLIGLAACDFYVRKNIRQQLLSELIATQNLTKAIETSHNLLSDQVKKLHDRVAAFDMGAFRK